VLGHQLLLTQTLASPPPTISPSAPWPILRAAVAVAAAEAEPGVQDPHPLNACCRRTDFASSLSSSSSSRRTLWVQKGSQRNSRNISPTESRLACTCRMRAAASAGGLSRCCSMVNWGRPHVPPHWLGQLRPYFKWKCCWELRVKVFHDTLCCRHYHNDSSDGGIVDE
jgi:hypothetical protein